MMLFKILKLLGLDVPAKMAAAKSEIEQRVEEVVDYAKQATQTAAAIAGLSAAAGVLVAMAVGVGLYALWLSGSEPATTLRAMGATSRSTAVPGNSSKNGNLPRS
jgi:hypothetical protein